MTRTNAVSSVSDAAAKTGSGPLSNQASSGPYSCVSPPLSIRIRPASRNRIPDPGLGERLAYNHNAMGAVASPFDSWMVLRSLKTLGVRMDRHSVNAARVVEFLVE